ncbi:helix-turn-helix domain-containing protein [Halostella litorea]|uniref:helix-turn-helix domain-containing protein n=1 Tax=Halostella litorea TaxID=2528831 RepID=UPI0010932DB5|nr:helix-turn-helix domain-containing protein [Halostella litorea]
MGVIVEFTVDDESLLLRDTLSEVPSMRLEIVQDTASRDGLPIFYFWATGGEYGAFEAALADDESVADYELLERLDDRRLYRVKCSRNSFYDAYREAAATMDDLAADGDGWHLRMRFPDRESLREYRSMYEEAGVQITVHRLFADSGGPGDAFGLTEKQREVLTLAHRRGYFARPREVTLEELAAELDVSPQAVSATIGRALETLVGATVASEPGGR